MAGQGWISGGSGQRNRSHRPRPWPVPPPSVARTAPESAAHGRIADGDGGQGAVCVDAAGQDLALRIARRCPIGRACSGLTFAAESSVHFSASGCCPWCPWADGRGRAGARMAGAVVRERATFAGRADQVREARAFVGRLLGPSHPCADVAVLLASEMVTNSVLHGDWAGPGEAVMFTVVVGDAGVRVEVTGPKADGAPGAAPPDEAEAAGGCGWCRSWPSGGVTSGAGARPWPVLAPG
jgi:hypothetical protein